MKNEKLQLAHIGEETEEHLEVEDIQTQISVSPAPSQEKQTIDIGIYFAAAIIVLAVIGFIILKFLKKKSKGRLNLEMR